jgi:hypothetical protein
LPCKSAIAKSICLILLANHHDQFQPFLTRLVSVLVSAVFALEIQNSGIFRQARKWLAAPAPDGFQRLPRR